MKKKFYCPNCGTTNLSKLFIRTHKGNNLSLLLSSQSQIRKSSGDVCCVECKKEWHINELQEPSWGRQQAM